MESESIHSQIEDLSSYHHLTNSTSASGNPNNINNNNNNNYKQFIQHFVSSLETNVNQIVSQHSHVPSLPDQHFDAYMDRLRAEIEITENESASIIHEINHLKKSYTEGSCKLGSNLETLRHALDYAPQLKGLGQDDVDDFEHVENYLKLSEGQEDCFETLELKRQVEANNETLKSLQDLDLKLKRIEAIEKIEDAFTGLKVIGFEGNSIRVSLKTCIPSVEGLTSQLKVTSEVNHELLMDVDGSMEIKNAEIFPDDIYLGEIVEAANSFSKLFSVLPLPETRSSLGWFMQRVQDRIVTCITRQLMVKVANKSRHSFEYVDKDETIIAHIDGGVDAFIKPPQGWPLVMSALKLVSLRSSDQNANSISLSLLCKVEEAANSLDINVRNSITNFVDGIEVILLEKMRLELHSVNN